MHPFGWSRLGFALSCLARGLVGVAFVVGLSASGALAPLARAAPLGVDLGPTALRIGDLPPPLQAERITGTDDLSLPRLRGRVVVMDFWATWCRPCRSIMPVLDALYRRLHHRGLTVLGVSSEQRSTIEGHLSRTPVTYTVARDIGHTQLRYGVRALPTLVVLDRRGRVRDVRVGVEDLASLFRLIEQLLAESGP